MNSKFYDRCVVCRTEILIEIVFLSQNNGNQMPMRLFQFENHEEPVQYIFAWKFNKIENRTCCLHRYFYRSRVNHIFALLIFNKTKWTKPYLKSLNFIGTMFLFSHSNDLCLVSLTCIQPIFPHSIFIRGNNESFHWLEW